MSRREFLKLSSLSAATAGLLYIGLAKYEGALPVYAESNAITEIPVIWLQGGSCTGCSVSLLNSLSPNIQNVLVDETIPGKHLNLRFHTTIMASEGEKAVDILTQSSLTKGSYVLVVEGAIPTKDQGVYCEVGEVDGKGITILEHVKNLGGNAMAVIALGTCAAYGGIPAAEPNPTSCVGVMQVFADAGIKTPVINVPGCPPHPDWFVGTVATILLNGLEAVKVDQHGRPIVFYGKRIHDICPRNGYFQLGQFSKKFSDPYCMYQLGCKGPVTYADCPSRMWNSGTNWCIGANSLCIGCTEPGFPDKLSPLRKEVEDWQVVPLAVSRVKDDTKGIGTGAAAALGAVAGAAIVGAGGAIISNSMNKQGEEEKKE
ncbi:MAG: hydrogenase small subunit [Dehalococcoidia bacterium]|nr:hydrogenase small subunit [Dehalococcoidia bacterium]